MDVFLNFMIMDINRNVLRKNPDKAIQSKVEQLTRLWGDETWRGRYFQEVRGTVTHGDKFTNRMDRRNLEPGNRLRQDKPRLQTLLRGTHGQAANGHGQPQLQKRI